jgi:hypothetical protein
MRARPYVAGTAAYCAIVPACSTGVITTPNTRSPTSIPVTPSPTSATRAWARPTGRTRGLAATRAGAFRPAARSARTAG